MVGSPPQVSRPKRLRQQFVKGERPAEALWSCDMNERRIVGEFADALSAATAGGAELFARPDNADFSDAALAGERHRTDGAGLGAVPDRVGGVLDIAAGKYSAARRANRRADLEARIGRIGVLVSGFGRCEEFGERVSVL